MCLCMYCFITACYDLSITANELDGIKITISNIALMSKSIPCTTADLEFRRGEIKRVYCDESTTGRYVRITLPGNSKKLVICEVEVYGYRPGNTLNFICKMCCSIYITFFNKNKTYRVCVYNVHTYSLARTYTHIHTYTHTYIYTYTLTN